MSCKYDIIDEGGRKRVRALRHFTVQGRDVCPMELGGYVYDADTLSQDGNCWIFSGSLEYPGVRVLDEAIVDMGINLPKNNARPKSVVISGNSRIMGAISFETQSFGTVQTPAMFEQGAYNAVVGKVPVKGAASIRVRTPAPVFCGTVGAVAITSTAYEARLISLNEAGIIVSVTAWTVGGPAVTLTSTAPYALVEVRKVGETAISPTDVTAAGITVTQAREATVRIFNSSIVPVYNGVVTLATSILRYEVTDPRGIPYQINIQNSYIRIECVFNVTNVVRANADFTRVNYNLALTSNVSHYITGTYRNTNINSPASVNVAEFAKNRFDVSGCPDFEYSTVTFPDLAAMIASGKTFYFKNCNMPAGSAIHYYDPKVNVWDNIDFTKAMEDLGKAPAKGPNIVLVSSDRQGWYRLFGTISKSFGALIEALSSVDAANIGSLSDSYGTVIHKDHTITGTFIFKGCNVFGGAQGGASKLVNTTGISIKVDGNFRIEGNAQVTDTPLKGTGYIGGNAELKNGNVEGYIYMQDNAKYIPEKVTNIPAICRCIMSGNTKVLKHYDAVGVSVNFEMYDNAVIDSPVSSHSGLLVMRHNSSVYRVDANNAVTVQGRLEMTDNARVAGAVFVKGDVRLVGSFNLNSGSRTIYGKRVIASPDDIDRPELPPTKTTW